MRNQVHYIMLDIGTIAEITLLLRGQKSTEDPFGEYDQGDNKIDNEDEVQIESPLTLTPTAKAELDLSFAKFILQYRLPFSIVAPLNTFVKQVSTMNSNQVFQDSRKTITTTTSIISNTLQFDLYQELRNSPFSMSLDISSDVHGYSYLAICARFLEEDNYERPVTKLLSILPINDSSIGETLFKMISDKFFFENEIKLHFMGIVSDDGSNITGEEKGVAQRLTDVYTHIITFKDISHGLNNIFKKALKAIPAHIQSIIISISISSHFHRSPQRCSILREILIENDMKPLEIVQVSATRWLSMRDSIERT